MAEEIKEELDQEIEGEKKEEPKKQDMVPHAALHEERMRNKQLQEQLRTSKETAERMESTFQKMLGALNEKPAPKFEEDPLGHIATRNETLEKELTKVSEKLESMTKQSSQVAFMQHVNSEISAAETEFRSQHPDYDAALKYLKDVTRSDLTDQGVDPAQIEQTLQAGKIGLAHTAIQQGKNPAQVIYERAKRYGYQAKSSEDKIQTLAKGQQFSKTVEGGSSAGLTLRDLAQLPDDQIDELCKDEAKFQKLIRGEMIR